MCISSGPAEFTSTKIYVGEAIKMKKIVHVIAYQNNAEAKALEPNAMILPFPTSVEMNEDNIIDTSEFPNFLQDIADASKIVSRSLSMKSLSDDSLESDGVALVFDSGSYTIVLAKRTSEIQEALQRVPEHKRPVISNKFLQGFDRLYPYQPIAVCCWSGSIEAEPMLWWYEPTDEDTLFIPTMDAHSGDAPDPTARVKMDHLISVGSVIYDTNNLPSNRVNYSNKIPLHIGGLLPGHAFGAKFHRNINNGDMFVKTSEFMKQNKYKAPMIKRGVSSSNTYLDDYLAGWSE